jgi:hypothetical protein
MAIVWTLGLSYAVVPTLIRVFNFPEGLPFGDTVRYMASTLALGLFNAIVIPGVALLARTLLEIFDRYHSPVERVVEQEKRKTALQLKELEWDLDHTDKPDGTPLRDEVVVVRGVGAHPRRPSPAELFRLAVIDFLELFQAEKINTDQGSWRGTGMSRSGARLTRTLGNDIRDFLMRSGYAGWDNPSSRKGGWHFLFPPHEIVYAMEAAKPDELHQDTQEELPNGS